MSFPTWRNLHEYRVGRMSSKCSRATPVFLESIHHVSAFAQITYVLNDPQAIESIQSIHDVRVYRSTSRTVASDQWFEKLSWQSSGLEPFGRANAHARYLGWSTSSAEPGVPCAVLFIEHNRSSCSSVQTSQVTSPLPLTIHHWCPRWQSFKTYRHKRQSISKIALEVCVKLEFPK